MSLLRKPQSQPSYKPRNFTGNDARVEETGWLSDKAKAMAKKAEKYAEKKLGKARVDEMKGLVKGIISKEGEEKEEKEKE